MKYSRKNSTLKFVLLFLSACSTTNFKVSNRDDHRIELSLTPDRILLTCPKVSKEEDIHLFMMPILDEANTVVMVIQSNNFGQEDCDDRLRDIEKILKRGRKIYLAGMGDLEKPRNKRPYSYTFPGHGTFYDHGRSLQFMAIANEQGDCYSAYQGADRPCPREPFPIKDNP